MNNNTINYNKHTYLNKTFEKVVKHFDTPLEKFKTVVALTLLFSLVYYVLFTIDNNHFDIAEDKVSGNGYFTFLWLSSTVNFTVPMGDVYPLTVAAKVLFMIHISMFWFVMLA